MLIVQSKVATNDIRFINAYGRQENCPESDRREFFCKLEEEVNSAVLSGSVVCSELDANSKLRGNIIKGEPKKMSPNGKLLADFIYRNNLHIVNARII